jgi:hypothetical protein
VNIIDCKGLYSVIWAAKILNYHVGCGWKAMFKYRLALTLPEIPVVRPEGGVFNKKFPTKIHPSCAVSNSRAGVYYSEYTVGRGTSTAGGRGVVQWASFPSCHKLLRSARIISGAVVAFIENISYSFFALHFFIRMNFNIF